MFSYTSDFELKNRVLHLLTDLLERAINSSEAPNLKNLEKNKEKLVDDFTALVKKYSNEQIPQLNIAKMVELTGISEDEIVVANGYDYAIEPTKNIGEAIENYRRAREIGFYSSNTIKAIKQIQLYFME